MKEDEAQRLKALEQENARLKKIVAEQALDISLLKDLQRGKRLVGFTPMKFDGRSPRDGRDEEDDG